MRRSLAIVLGVLLLCFGTIGTTAPAHAATLALTPVTLGNVFTDGQQVKIGLSTDASSVTWSAADVNGTVVATGSQATASTLQVSVTTRGWYKLTVQAGTVSAQTTFAILSPLSTASIAGLTTNRVGDFENTAEGWTFYPGSEFPGATGSFALDTADNHSGTSSGKLSGNFSAGGAYVSVNRTLPSVNASSVSFWAKSPNLSFLTFRITDSTGQVHQQRLTLSGATDWQPLSVARFDGGKQYVHFGGANDGVWHGPAKGLEVVLDKGAITGATSSSVSLDDFTVNALSTKPTTPLGDYESAAEGWSFYPGSEFAGATGSLTYDTTNLQAGAQSAKLSGDFTGGGNYVAIQRNLVPINLTALSLWVKTSQLSAIGLRLTDATGQVHQQRLTLSGSTAWQQLNVTTFNGGTGYLHFGGADDGVWHGPAKAIMLTLDKSLIIGGGTTASVNVDAVAATTPTTYNGVGTHFAGSWAPDVIPLVSQAGARTARDEAYWSAAETTAGTYAFPAKVTTYLQSYQSNGLDPLMVADYGNCLYDCPDQLFNAPYTDAGRTAFANYANALANQYPQVHNLAVWNEWDVNAAGPANKSPDSYFALLKATYTKLKATHPDLTIVGGGDTDVTQQAWFQTFCQLGGLKYLDVVSIHPYNFLHAPESLGTAIDQVRATIRQYNGGVDKPIWITEAGWYTGSGSAVPVDEPTQAMYMAREMLNVPGHDVDRFYMYDFKNDGIDPAAAENNFGLVHNEADALGKYTPKPSYVAYATAARQLRGATFLGKENPGNGLIDQVYAGNDGTPFRAIWAASGSNTTVTVNATGPVQVTSLYGLTSTMTPNANGQITVTVGVWPTYISGSTVTSVTAP
ncbi:putative glycosyl hydrolase [Kribbella rubisoli]|uniref:Glycosyl hydrolase n=1 Tax=Kribbella rubisoli TaxID=3075929 RepID=A0A4Q7WVA0_9ACTN|nr:glycosyl hydrolase [Kribbella rubisoli]RZU13953.1 putative glycosyl hydrolase [Kribbella rubisoli]